MDPEIEKLMPPQDLPIAGQIDWTAQEMLAALGGIRKSLRAIGVEADVVTPHTDKIAVLIGVMQHFAGYAKLHEPAKLPATIEEFLNLDNWTVEEFLVCVDGIKCPACAHVSPMQPKAGPGSMGNWQCEKCSRLSELAIVKTPLGMAWRTKK